MNANGRQSKIYDAAFCALVYVCMGVIVWTVLVLGGVVK